MDIHNDTYEENILSIPGKKKLYKLNAMAAVKRSMRASGWLNKC